MKDYYLILGVSRSETAAGIRSAFRDLARRHHPDVAGQESTPLFRELVEAYETLSDPVSRRDYDDDLRREARDARGPRDTLTARLEPVSLFGRPGMMRPSPEALLERWFRNFTGADVPKAEQPEPLVCDVLLSREEARRGGVLPIRIPLLEPCTLCHGAGSNAFFPCLACDARGWHTREALLRLPLPRGVRSGSTFDLSLARLGIANLWLHVRVRVAPP